MFVIRRGTVIAGRYRLVEPLAKGGMGTVWAAEHVSLGNRLAIKFIGAEGGSTTDEARNRFEREAKTAALLQSPHVVQVHDYGVDRGLQYLAMELLKGEDLGVRLARRRKLTRREVLDVVTQVARALRHAADAGIVHRDIKPSNVFIVQGDDEEFIKVLDFGVAKADGTKAVLDNGDPTRTGVLVGSPRYMSPEQTRGTGKVDHRSDLWSLAVIAYRALTGRLPFRGEDMAEIIISICTGTAPPPSSIDESLDAKVDAFFERALAREPDERFQSARDFAAAFARAMGAERPLDTTQVRPLTGSDAAKLLLPTAPRVVPRPEPNLQRADGAPPAAPAPIARREDEHSTASESPNALMGRASQEPPPAPEAVPAPVAEPQLDESSGASAAQQPKPEPTPEPTPPPERERVPVQADISLADITKSPSLDASYELEGSSIPRRRRGRSLRLYIGVAFLVAISGAALVVAQLSEPILPVIETPAHSSAVVGAPPASAARPPVKVAPSSRPASTAEVDAAAAASSESSASAPPGAAPSGSNTSMKPPLKEHPKNVHPILGI